MIHEIIKYGLLGIGGTIVSSYIIESRMKDYDTVVEPPVDTVSIIMPSYNEELFIEEACKSIKNQSIIQQYPEFFEFILVDSGSIDRTIELATPYIDKIIIAGRGKLTARNLATDMAKGNIIVAVDSDTFYPEYAMNTLLKAFDNDNVVGVSGHTLDYSISNIPGQLFTIIHTTDRLIFNRNQMPGRFSAYRKDAFYKVGKFNEKINQLNLNEMLYEEEILFGDKLNEIGEVRFIINSTCVHLGGLKVSCRYNTEIKEKCELLKLGVERF